jgi:16S rRNA (guanine527-N7)-methyltransferase
VEEDVNSLEFRAATAAFGIALKEDSLKWFEVYERELLAWNRRMNLISRMDEANLWGRHFLDSLVGWSLAFAQQAPPCTLRSSVIDIGAGGGFPGIPIKVVWPEVQLTLVESVRKKTLFLKHLVETLNLKGVHVFCARAEALAKDPLHCGHYDFALARAVGTIEDLRNLSRPFLSGNGQLIAWRSGEEEAEVSERGFSDYHLPGETRARRILVLPKGRLTRPGELG